MKRRTASHEIEGLELRDATNGALSRQPSGPPPAFDDAQFDDIILRRARSKDEHKSSRAPARPTIRNATSHFFSGWGDRRDLELTTEDLAKGDDAIVRHPMMGAFVASAVVGNDVLGSPFYALPALFAASGPYAVIGVFVSTLAPFIWRPIMAELASALPIPGALYGYALNVTAKRIALIGAACSLLDFAATSIVSAATAAAYLQAEVSIDIPSWTLAAAFLAVFALLSLAGLRESSRIAFVIMAFHLATMAALIIASIVAWARLGNSVIAPNWRDFQPSNIGRSIFDGACIGALGLTGFEPGRYPTVLRNLHLLAIVTNTLTALISLALLPMDTILSGDNVLSAAAAIAGGRALRVIVVIDAIVVLGAGVFTGILSANAMIERLAGCVLPIAAPDSSSDRVLPSVLLAKLPVTRAPWLSTLSFCALCAIVYATTGASLSTISSVFAFTFLASITSYPISLILLKFNRDRLPRARLCSLPWLGFALAMSAVLVGGNVALNPAAIGLFAVYALVLYAVLLAADSKADLLHVMLWVVDQSPWLHGVTFAQTWPSRLIEAIRGIKKRQPVIIFIGQTDEIAFLLSGVNYVRANESTSKLYLVMCYNNDAEIPADLEAVRRILDEGYPTLTINLVLVKADWSPRTVAAICSRLKVPRSLAFMTAPSDQSTFTSADLGLRVIA